MHSEKSILAAFLSISFIHCGSPAPSIPGSMGRPSTYISEKSLCPGAVSESSDGYGGGDGTVGNPYLICTIDQFKNIQGDMKTKRFFRLTADLDFASEGNIRIIAISPLASIDGDNHKLKNITIEHGHGYKDNGLFGQLIQDLNGNRDEIKNLIIENVTVTGDGAEDRAGVVAGANWGGAISNVHVTGIVKVEYPDTNPNTWSVGGLVGENAYLIENSSFEGRVTGIYNVGGIAGINSGTIRNSTASGSIQGHLGVGGIVGVQLQPGFIDNAITQARVFAVSLFGDQVGVLCKGSDYSSCNISK